jgi:hypothetical protein
MEKPTKRALSERMFKLRKQQKDMVKSGGDSAPSTPKGTPRSRSKKVAATPGSLKGVKRARVELESSDSEVDDSSEVDTPVRAKLAAKAETVKDEDGI